MAQRLKKAATHRKLKRRVKPLAPGKRRINPVKFFLAVALICLVAFLIWWRLQVTEPAVRIELLPALNASTVSFFVDNARDLPAECLVQFSVGGDSFQRGIGIVGPESRKLWTEPLTTAGPVHLNASCVWREMDTTGCDNTSFLLCEAARANVRIRQCLVHDFDYQHFCAALISKDTSYCAAIAGMARKVHCYAYVAKRPEWCENYTAERDWCYQDLAMNWGRDELCGKIGDDRMRTACSAVMRKDVSLCLSLSDNQACITHLAVMLRNSTLCTKATNPAACFEDIGYEKQ